MFFRHAILSLAGLVLLAGCATRYQDGNNLLTGWTGGYWEDSGPGELVKVGFSGNSNITTETVSAYLLYRCAEVAKRANKPYFALYRSLPAAVQDVRSPDQEIDVYMGKPDSYVYILYFDQAEEGLLETSEVLARLESQVKGAAL